MKKVLLIIMDGWGIGDKSEADVIYSSETNFTKSLYKKTFSVLHTSGEDVGLPDGQMGNSEVGHLNIGAGRIVYQDLVRINKAVRENTMDKNPVLLNAIEYAKKNNKKIHLLGLVSDGGVHSSMEHLFKICDIAKDNSFNNLYIHALMDGRDTDPKSGVGYLKSLREHLKHSSGEIATVSGRYYCMDRDNRWERVKIAYDMLLEGKGKYTKDVIASLEDSYNEGVTDEFVKPIVKTNSEGKPLATIERDDVVICFNFRTDRCREISIALTQKDMPENGMKTLPLHYLTMTRYDDNFKNVSIIYDKEDLKDTLGEIISKNGKKQIRIAETEKYPHVTFFFSGGRENEFENEKRILIPSPKVATYDMQPEMSALLVRDAIIPELKKGEVDFICLNFANADMVGHTGVYSAIKKAVETVDSCVETLSRIAEENGYTILITADHGNADLALNKDHSPNTAHTTNPVPLFLIDKDYKHLKEGRLCDLAPTILKLLDIEIPSIMEGNILVY